jgi:hypothetical protein
MAEKDLWAILRDRVKTIGHFERIENMVGVGMPDVTYCVRGVEGFIELKQIKEFPARAGTVVSVDHYTPQQRIWARRRISAGGRVYLLLEVVRPTPTYFLYWSEWSRVHLGVTATESDCRRSALVTGVGKFPTPDLIREITAVNPAI